MTDQSAAIAHLERQAFEADRMAAKSPFAADRKRFATIAANYRAKASGLRGYSTGPKA